MKLKQFIKDSGGSTRDYGQIDPRLLQVRPDFNIRDLTTPAARERLDNLKAQIKAEGVLEPVEIEFDGETPWINEGHRRHIVVMELIAEGHDFKTIPCIQERSNSNPSKRTLHMLMRKKEDYEPLEYAKGLARMVDVYGWERGALAASLGEAKATIDRHLAMLGMTEEVQDQVAQGIVSATAALKVTRDTRDAKTDPAFAAELIRAAAEEKKRLGKKGRATPKAIARATERSKPKTNTAPEKPHADLPAQTPAVLEPTTAALSGLSQGEDVTVGSVAECLDTGLDREPETAGHLVDVFNRWTPPSHSLVAAHALGSLNDLIEALEPFAKVAGNEDAA